MVCGVFIPSSNQYFTVAFVYARNRDTEKHPMWELLSHIASYNLIQQSPWLVIGDFNQVLSSNDMFSIFPFVVSRLGMVDFQEWWPQVDSQI